MFYKLLGFVVWKAGIWYLHRRYGAAMAPKSVIAGAAVAALVGALLGARQLKSGSGEDS
jgi:hypothetical protein